MHPAYKEWYQIRKFFFEWAWFLTNFYRMIKKKKSYDANLKITETDLNMWVVVCRNMRSACWEGWWDQLPLLRLTTPLSPNCTLLPSSHPIHLYSCVWSAWHKKWAVVHGHKRHQSKSNLKNFPGAKWELKFWIHVRLVNAVNTHGVFRELRGFVWSSHRYRRGC